MLCNQTTSYFGTAAVIACNSVRSEKGLAYLLDLAAQNPRADDKFKWLLNPSLKLNGHTFGNTIQLLVTLVLVTSVY